MMALQRHLEDREMRPILTLLISTFVLTSMVPAKSRAADKVVLFPLSAVNVDAETVKAIEMNLASDVNAHGFWVVRADEAKTEAESPDKNSTGQEASTQIEISAQLAAKYFITGSIVRLGEETTVALELHQRSGSIVSAKKVVARNEAELPRAVTTIAMHVANDMSVQAAPVTPPPASPAIAPVQQVGEPEPPPKKESGVDFQKNLGVSIGQSFSLRDEMYGFTSFNFNGRFEFNRILFVTNAGFGMGNKNFEDGFHFNLDLALAAYLRKGQITPYMGGGVGLSMGNRFNPCADFKEPVVSDTGVSPSYSSSSYCYDDDESIIAWQFFPVFGIEFLRTFKLRLHIEVRYLVAFNSEKEWGHGPMPVLGAAF